MKLVVPCLGTLHSADARLVRLAEFLGCRFELLSVEKGCSFSIESIKNRVGEENSCLVINPAVVRECYWSDFFPDNLASSLTSQFSFLLVHNLSFDSFSATILNALSLGSLGSVHPVETAELCYEVASEYDHVCGPFSGLTFGPVNATADRFIAKSAGPAAVRTYIGIGGQPLLAGIQRQGAEVLVLANAEIADLDAENESKVLRESFSKLVPPAMLLRYVFGEECWRPNQNHAAFIIDDPLLRRNYGFLNYERLLRLMDEFNFHTSIAFIPHNYLRNSKSIARMFRERPDRFSICFHGNDHTAAEFAARDSPLLNSLLTEAEERLRVFHTKTGIPVDDVMVFPQGHFSRDAMKVLKAHNFSAAVNSGPYPLGECTALTLSDIIQPAILKYSGFPLFLREYVGEMTTQDVAFYLFFGKPVFIMEHHEFFKDPKSLPELVSRINRLAPDIHWSNLRTAVRNSYLVRKAVDRTLQIRAYSSSGSITNNSDGPLPCYVNWPGSPEASGQEVFLDGLLSSTGHSNGAGFRLFCELPPHVVRTFALVHDNGYGFSDKNRGFRWKAQAFLRRRLSEVRDNYLSRCRPLLTAAKGLQRRLWRAPH
ncbi:MAG TPA: hypothetical protein VMI32_01765 [Candidatus Solibacter sp.]|nr:hypothetical protein [Candidatus Solibacter sp.]